VEEAFGRELELFPEFTGLMGWGPGAAIDWHFDANRPYLAKRDFAAVLHLSRSGDDFTGGDFLFRDGTPARVVPQPGMLVAYTAGADNIHCVEPIQSGRRATLTMWFSLSAEASEDSVVLASLNADTPSMPDTMWLGASGQDVRIARMEAHGFELVAKEGQSGNSSYVLRVPFQFRPPSTLDATPTEKDSCREAAEIHCSSLAEASLTAHFYRWIAISSTNCALPVGSDAAGEGSNHGDGESSVAAQLSRYLARLTAALPPALEQWHSSGHLHINWPPSLQ